MRTLCDRHGLVLIDDACEALGARYRGAPVGAQGQDAVFAFYPNKQITTGEGGMVTTHSEDTWRLLQSLRNQGRADGGGWLDHARLGFNYRIDDIRAAIGIGQLEKLDRIVAARADVAQRYSELLSGIDGLELPCPDDDEHTRSWFVYVVALPADADRELVIERLATRGIQTARYLPCIHLQAYMRERYGFSEGHCPVAEAASRRTLAIPFHARLPEPDQEYVATAASRRARGVSARPRPGQGEALLVWAVWALVAVAVLVTYSRIDPDVLYKVSGEGVSGGLSRALVFINYPLALVAITLILIATAALAAGSVVVRGTGARPLCVGAVRRRPGRSRCAWSGTPARRSVS